MKRLLAAMMLSAGMTAPVFPAAITTETFNAGADGWDGSVALSGSWTFTGGVAQAIFDDIGVPFPDTAVLSNQPSAASAAFTGNYDAVGIELIGFRFRAPTHLPSDVVLSWGGSTSVFQRSFPVAQTGVWYTFAASLASAALGGWTNASGSLTDFETARQQVKFVAIRISRAGSTERRYQIDDVFLDRLPVGGGFSVGASDLSLQWSSLRSGMTYRVEGTTNLLATPWSALDTFAASNATQQTTVPGTNAIQFLRLTIP